MTETTPEVLDLPKKDDDGMSYLSYSQISLFLKDKKEYYRQYILGEPFEGNWYTEFGQKVGKAIETNCFDEFSWSEQEVLKQVPRLDEFEKETRLKYDKHGFYIKGFIDTNLFNLAHIIDYKTGGKGKYTKYLQKDYTQLCYYALSLRQEFGITPLRAQVCFIERGGNAFKGESLFVVNKKPLIIEIDISEARLKSVYWNTIKIAKQIESFYKQYKK